MAPYLQKALWQFDNIVPTQRHNSHYPHIEPKYGVKQHSAEYDTSAPFGQDEQSMFSRSRGNSIITHEESMEHF
jgi:hypothetical protein